MTEKIKTIKENSYYRAAAIVMRNILDGVNPFPVATSNGINGRKILEFKRTIAIDDIVLSWKNSPLNAYTSLVACVVALMRGDEQPLQRFVANDELVRQLALLDDLLNLGKIEIG